MKVMTVQKRAMLVCTLRIFLRLSWIDCGGCPRETTGIFLGWWVKMKWSHNNVILYVKVQNKKTPRPTAATTARQRWQSKWSIQNWWWKIIIRWKLKNAIYCRGLWHLQVDESKSFKLWRMPNATWIIDDWNLNMSSTLMMTELHTLMKLLRQAQTTLATTITIAIEKAQNVELNISR